MINKVTFCLDDESGEEEEQEDEEEEELGDQSEAEDVGDLDDLLERANVELGGAITGPSRNAGKHQFGNVNEILKNIHQNTSRSKHISVRQTNKDLP
jgi:hypothetical protein